MKSRLFFPRHVHIAHQAMQYGHFGISTCSLNQAQKGHRLPVTQHDGLVPQYCRCRDASTLEPVPMQVTCQTFSSRTVGLVVQEVAV